MERNVRSVLLCEDLHHELLLRPVLERAFGRTPRVERAGGFTALLRRASREVSYVRRRPAEAVALVIAIDGDSEGHTARQAMVHEKCALQKSDRRKVGICIPCRNIETWVLWLNGEVDIDETTDYKLRVQNQPDRGMALTKKAASTWLLNQPERRELERTRLPALAHARAEIDRLASLKKS